MELTLPDSNRVVVLLQVVLDKAAIKRETFSCVLDDWVESINSVVEFLQRTKR